jgi:hypothetical protein
MRATLIAHLVLSFITILALSGCSSRLRYISDVNSIALTDQSIGKRYVLLPGNERVTPDDLEFSEYAQYVGLILAPLGFTKAATEQEADIAILVSYGIGNPQSHQYSSSIPVYGQTGVSSSTTSGTIMPLGGGMASYSGNTTYMPSMASLAIKRRYSPIPPTRGSLRWRLTISTPFDMRRDSVKCGKPAR